MILAVRTQSGKPINDFGKIRKVCGMIDGRRICFVHAATCSSWLGCKPKPGSCMSIENDKLTFQEDISKNGETNAGIGLDATEALFEVVRIC